MNTTQTYTVANTQLPLYGRQDPSPTDSTSPTPSNLSPTSPRMHNYLAQPSSSRHRQIRDPKTPLYVPAVLRPTEFSSKPAPMTPPKSLHGSLDSLEGTALDAAVEGARDELDAVMGNDWLDDEDLGDVTGPPNKDHWKPDIASPSCDSPKCRSSFNIFVRKHHCRHCGHIFCADHTSYTIPLDQDARFHPDGIYSRACDTCYRQYQKWDTARSIKRKNSNDAEVGPGILPSTPGVVAAPSHRRMISGPMKPAEQAANSVPRDWAWSTF